jgi:nucleotide-binding universal stress UspA family protein
MSERAVDVACTLASERKASVTVLSVVEVLPILPLDARMDEEEEGVQRTQLRAQAIGDDYGVRLVLRRVRARQAAVAILDELEGGDYDLVVLGAPRRVRPSRHASPFGRTVQQVLRASACRVLLVAAGV